MKKFTVRELRVVTFDGAPNPVHLISNEGTFDHLEIIMSDKAFVKLLEHGLNYVAAYNDGFDLVAEREAVERLKKRINGE